MDTSNTELTEQSGESGMTLIEVMVSTVVLGIVLIGLGQAMIYGIKVNNESKMRISNLNVCKYVTENLKTQITQSKADFDATDAADSTYYVDADGNKTYTGVGEDKKESFTSSSAFRVRAVTSDTDYTKTAGGVTSVLVKVLEVRVVDVQNMQKTGREVTMK